MARLLRIGITHGDLNGIGYEVVLKALAAEGITELCTPVIFGSSEIAHKVRKSLKLDEFRFIPVKRLSDVRDGQISVLDVCPPGLELTPGHASQQAGQAAVAALEAAADALEAGEIDVVVTAPINKKTVYSEQFPYPGHTEFFERRLGRGAKATMILFDDDIRVALVTTHLPLRRVPDEITKESVSGTIRAMDAALKRDFGFERPKIAVLSLNPHNGDNGLLGTEEQTAITPAIEECVADRILAFGPYAADGFFGNGTYRQFDGIVAMYHDQGLAPFKALAREYGVNYTAGLPYVRTSPDHGSGYDIAGKGTADPTSFRQAIYHAVDLFRHRINHDQASANPLKIAERPARERPERPERTAQTPPQGAAEKQEKAQESQQPDNQQ